MCGRVNIITRVATELDHEKALTCRELLQSFRIEMLDLFVVDEAMVDALKRDWLVRQYRGHGISCRHDVREAKHDQRPFPNDRDQAAQALAPRWRHAPLTASPPT